MNALPPPPPSPGAPPPSPRRALIGALLVAISAIGFGFMPLFASWAGPDGIGVAGLLATRFGLAAIVLWTIALARREALPRGTTLATLIVMGCILYFGESFGYYNALRHLPSGMVALVLYIYPVIVAVLARLVLKEPFTRAKLAALALAALGLALTLGLFEKTTSTTLSSGGVRGSAWALLAAVSYACYMIAGSNTGKRATPIISAAVVATGVALTMSVVAVATGDRLPRTQWGWTGAICLALIGTVLSLTTLLEGIKRIGPTRAATISCIEPLATAALGAAFLHESMTPVQWLGGVLILAGAVVATHAAARPPGPDPGQHISRN